MGDQHSDFDLDMLHAIAFDRVGYVIGGRGSVLDRDNAMISIIDSLLCEDNLNSLSEGYLQDGL